ncbi:MAG: 50S ribosomal protein L32 [Candidatus Paceibacterota bacterium]|jgi:large subunit ribosomal protein L32|nr:50S ribosomal protein L32 [bacterium]
MAVPKRHLSTSKRDRRRGNIFIKPITLVKCQKCGKPVLPHTICKFCGNYKGRDYLSVVSKVEKPIVKKTPKATKKKTA